MPTLVSACESKNFKAGETVAWQLALSRNHTKYIIRSSGSRTDNRSDLEGNRTTSDDYEHEEAEACKN